MSTATGKVQFDFGQMVQTSWELLKKYPGPLVGGLVIMIALNAAGNMIYIGSLILSGPLTVGMYMIALAAVRGQNVELADLFAGFKKFLPSFLAYLVTMIFTIVGMVFCIIPGIFVALIYSLVYLFIIDENMDFWPAMEASRKMVMNNLGQWILLFLVIILINLAGALACCVGLLISSPIAFLMITMGYEQERRALAASSYSADSPQNP